MNKKTKKTRKLLLKKKKDRNELVQKKDSELLKTGYAPLDVALSGKLQGGFAKGIYIMIVGDSGAGKTFISQTCLAEAARNPEFDDHEFYFDDIERGNLMNVRRFFGRAVAERMKPPRGTREEPIYSETVEDVYYNLDDLLKAGKPFIYIVDSMDGLDTLDDEDKFQEQKTAHRKGKQTTGSYGVSKAKLNSGMLKRMVNRLEKSGSILITIHQSRDKLGFGFVEKTRSGGRAPKFFAHVELWTSIKRKIKKTVLSKDRHIGNQVVIDIQKNRLTGWEGKVDMVFYKALGFDNTGGCIDYLVEEGYWKKGSGGINATDFDVKMDREKLVKYIEDNNLERKTEILVKKVFRDIQAQSLPDRKPRYV